MDVDVRHRRFDRGHDVEISLAGETRVDASLQANLRGARRGGLDGAQWYRQMFV
jgi:hypothetical protein